MSYFKNITHKVKEKMTNLMSNENGLEQIISNIDIP